MYLLYKRRSTVTLASTWSTLYREDTGMERHDESSFPVFVLWICAMLITLTRVPFICFCYLLVPKWFPSLTTSWINTIFCAWDFRVPADNISVREERNKNNNNDNQTEGQTFWRFNISDSDSPTCEFENLLTIDNSNVVTVNKICNTAFPFLLVDSTAVYRGNSYMVMVRLLHHLTEENISNVYCCAALVVQFLKQLSDASTNIHCRNNHSNTVLE